MLIGSRNNHDACLAAVCGFAWMLCVAGCGHGDGLVQIGGGVTYDGQPVKNGTISFLPPDGNGPTAAAIVADGKYSVKVAPGQEAGADRRLQGRRPTTLRPERSHEPDGRRPRTNPARTLQREEHTSPRNHLPRRHLRLRVGKVTEKRCREPLVPRTNASQQPPSLVNGLSSNSAGKDAITGCATILGDDPLKLQVVQQAVYKSDPSPYAWITGDEIYLLRVKPSIENINDASKYEFFDGGGWPRRKAVSGRDIATPANDDAGSVLSAVMDGTDAYNKNAPGEADMPEDAAAAGARGSGHRQAIGGRAGRQGGARGSRRAHLVVLRLRCPDEQAHF